MSLVHDVVPCRQCRLVFASDLGLRRHEVLDHTPAHDGAALTALLVGPPDQHPAPTSGLEDGVVEPAGVGQLLSGAACTALALAGWVVLLVLFVATRG